MFQVINANSHLSFLNNLATEKYSNLGDFDQCLSIANQANLKHCLAKFTIPKVNKTTIEQQLNSTANYGNKFIQDWSKYYNRFPYVQGLCVFEVCTEQQIEQLIRKGRQTVV